eukprot:5855598-Prymnesium_polylepis.1
MLSVARGAQVTAALLPAHPRERHRDRGRNDRTRAGIRRFGVNGSRRLIAAGDTRDALIAAYTAR